MGASLTFAFAPFGYWLLPFLVLPISFYLLAYKSKSTTWSAWWFGLGYFGAGISWVHVSIAEFGGVPLVVSVLLMLFLCSYLALFPALAFKLLSRFFKTQHWPLAIGFVWLAMEFLRARALTGFPWLSIAYSQTNSPLDSLYPLIGEIGLSAFIVLVSMSLAIALKNKRYLQATLPILVLFVTSIVLSNVQWSQSTQDARSVALVQGNIPQSMRFVPEQDKATMKKYVKLTENLWDHDIIVWPEAAVPQLEIMSVDYLSMLDDKATNTNTGFITGVVDYDLQTSIAQNALLALGIDKNINSEPYDYQHDKRFAKHHLLPIGEFVPFEGLLRPLAPIFDLPMSSFSRGNYVQDNLVAGNTHLAPAICFEIAFPKQIAANLTPQTNMIITVSNDAWFGDSHGPHQHLQIAQVRAKEFGLPVIRATNNGVTAAIDHKGHIIDVLPQFVADSLSVEITMVEGQTPYRKLGDTPTWLAMSTLFLLAIWLRRKTYS